ncbi:MAG: SDR family oxidoreductase, partial [Actinobacteria bacterium]|nr:SDR family oxidoreductase [Actinomycetota bacterium]NIV56722.1 SDR family oxidoreductase [Actinomycetota bacterium]NIV88243.1 SDR family oxidoreductase [Actinomycetota bacterium]
ARGARVAVVDLESSDGASVAAELGGMFVAADLGETADVEAAISHAAEGLGGIDVCVNAAGVLSAHRMLSRDGAPFPIDL